LGENNLKIGICGVGNMGRNHLRVCKKLEKSLNDFEISVIYDPNIAQYSNKQEFLEEVPDLDGVIVCAPSDKHVQIALELFKVNNNLKLLIEKPIDDDVSKAEELIPFEDRIFVGHIERFNPAVKKIKTLIEDNTITGINLIRTKRLSNFTARSSKFINSDLLVHDVDISNFLLNDRVKEAAIFNNETKNDGKIDYALLSGRYDNQQKTILSAEASWIEPGKIRTLELICNEGKYILDYVAQELRYISYTGDIEDISIKKSEPLYEELLHFRNFIDGTSASGCTVNDALEALRTVVDGNTNLV
jgi:UDP-N-acetylglucosamine 3-dehydrogenase|tara:strand:+ start:731 stop:1639 length:909 start_codon:yes stop_codon:yes gene_type:complete